MRHHCSVVCAPGLEPVVAAELRALGLRPGPARRGGVAVAATTRQLYAANRWLRTATRVLVRVGRFRATRWADLEAGLAQLDWDARLPPGRPLHLRVSSTGSRLYHTGAIADRVARVLDRPLADDADAGQLLVVRVAADQVTVSLDSTGEALHRRGWRLATAKAPLRPTLAAAMLLAVGWDGTVPLVDPFGGSGTIAIEAALLARDRPPGGDRTFAFRHWPDFEPGTWSSVEGEVARRARPGVAVPILVRDRDAGAVEATRANAERAGVLDDLVLESGPVSTLVAPEGGPGWVVTNPPYGRRVGRGGDLRSLYQRFGDVVRTELPGWGVALLAADDRLARQTGLALAPQWAARNGGVAVRLLATGGPGLSADGGAGAPPG